jgi:hypothetical protein
MRPRSCARQEVETNSGDRPISYKFDAPNQPPLPKIKESALLITEQEPKNIDTFG